MLPEAAGGHWGHNIPLGFNWEILEATGGLLGDTIGSTGGHREGPWEDQGPPCPNFQMLYWLFTSNMNETPKTLEIEVQIQILKI